MNHTHNRWILDKGEFVKRDFTVTPTGNGGIIAYLTRPVNEQDRGSVANPSDRVSFTTPVDFIEWLKGEYGIGSAEGTLLSILEEDADAREQGKREPVWKPLTPDPHAPPHGDHRDDSCDGSVECETAASAPGKPDDLYIKPSEKLRQRPKGFAIGDLRIAVSQNGEAKWHKLSHGWDAEGHYYHWTEVDRPDAGDSANGRAIKDYVAEERARRRGPPPMPEKPITWENINTEIDVRLAWR